MGIAKMAEVLNMEEVVDMQEVSVEEVPEEVAHRFLNMLEDEKSAAAAIEMAEEERSSRFLDLDNLAVDEEPSADELDAQVEEITSLPAAPRHQEAGAAVCGRAQQHGGGDQDAGAQEYSGNQADRGAGQRSRGGRHAGGRRAGGRGHRAQERQGGGQHD